MLPKSFPIPIEGRADFFCVDPTSLSTEQLNEYKREMLQLMDIEKNNLERITKDSNARINAYNQGILLAQESCEKHVQRLEDGWAIKTNSMHPKNLPDFKSTADGSIGCVDPKTLTTTQLQLYIQGITEEITYENTLSNEFKNESTSRIEAYQDGIQHANNELSIRKGK